jgi:hypothetical protein
MGVTPGVVEPTFQSRSARRFPWKPGIAGRFFSKSCAVPNVYQSALVRFAFDLGTEKPLKLIKSSIILTAAESSEIRECPETVALQVKGLTKGLYRD